MVLSKTSNFPKTLITCDLGKINLLVVPPTFLSPYAFSGVEYVNWICSFMLLAVQKPGKRKSSTFRPSSVKALPYNRWKSCLVKGSLTGPKSQQLKQLYIPLHNQLVKMSDFFTVTVSDLLNVRLSYCKTVRLSDFQTIVL